MTQTIQDNAGRVIGRIQEINGNQKVYMDAASRVIARVIDGGDKVRTFDAQGRFVGFGDQGMRVLGAQ